MKILLTNNFDQWIQSCRNVSIKECCLNNFIDAFSEKIHSSCLLRDPKLGPGTAAALVEYEIKRKQPSIVTIDNAKLICVSLPTNNGELEEHYYFVNDRNEWLTENPFLAQYQYWFRNAEHKETTKENYYASTTFPIHEINTDNATGSAVFLGGRMNWTHWNIDCLAPLLLLEPSAEEYLITSKLTNWQIDGLNYFGYGNLQRVQVSRGKGISIIRINKLRFAWNFDQIDRLWFMRNKICSFQMQSSAVTNLELLAPDLDHKLHLKRIANAKMLKISLSKYTSGFINPSSLSYSEKAFTYARARSVLTLPGSDSINALLFAGETTKIIQMIPWPNGLMQLSKYSMIVAFRQMAYQSSLNVVPYYGRPKKKLSIDFNSQFYYCPLEIESLLSMG